MKLTRHHHHHYYYLSTDASLSNFADNSILCGVLSTLSLWSYEILYNLVMKTLSRNATKMIFSYGRIMTVLL